MNSVSTLSPDFDGVIIYGEHTNGSAADRTAADAALASAATAQLGVDVLIEPGGEVFLSAGSG